MRCPILRTISVAFLGLILLGFTVPAHAQFRASVQGTVTDATGAIVPGATVTLTNKETNHTQTTTASDSGFYRFPALPPGLYTVTVSRDGFKKQIVDGVKVDAETVRGVDVVVEVGTINETITVTDDTVAALQTEDANVRRVITTSEIQRLPQIGRDPYELARLAPGVFGAGARNSDGSSNGLPNTSGPGASSIGIFATENRPPISANGQRVSANNFQIDGVSVNSQTWGGAAVITPTQEAVKEIQVTSSTYSAEDGRNSGAQIKVVTQNGTNDFHGSLFFKYQDPDWNAFSRGFNIPGTTRGAAPARVEIQDRTFGGSLGGPIYKNKLFFFFAYEGLRNNTNNLVQSFVETAQFRSLISTLRPNSIAARVLAAPGIEPRIAAVLNRSCSDFTFPDPAPTGGQPRCQAVAGGFDLGSPARLLGQYVPNDAANRLGGGFDGIPDVQFVQLQNPRSTSGNQYVSRIDYEATQKDRFAFTLFYSPANIYGSDTGAQSRPMADIRSDRLNWNTAFTYIRNLSPTMVNEARFNITKWGFNEVDSNPDINFGIPRIEIESFIPNNRLRFGANRSSNTPGIISERQIDVRDDLTWIVSSHGMKIGGAYRKDLNQNPGTGAARPIYSFVRWNFANDTPIFEAITADYNGTPIAAAADFSTGDLSFYFQDDWKVRPNLTVNLGLRWEYYQPLQAENLGVLQFGSNGLADATVVAGATLTKSDYNNFGPQFGFAWTPKVFGDMFEDKLVLRGGVGIGYDRLPNALPANSRNNPPNGLRYSICCADQNNPFLGGQILYTLGSGTTPDSYPRNPNLGGGANPNGGPNIGTVEIYGLDQNLRTPVIYRYSLEAQYKLPLDLIGTLGYQGSNSRNYVRIEPLHLTQTVLSTTFRPVFYGFGDVSGNFNGMNARLQRRFTDGLMFDFNYRFSKSLDSYSFEGPCGCTNQTYPVDQRTEYGPSDYDVTHNFTLSALWDIPFYRTQRDWAGKLLGGWQINSIVSRHSGFPWTPILNSSLVGPNGATFGPVRPIRYLGGQPADNTNDNFLRPGGIFPGGGATYFSTTVVGNNYLSNPPGIGRNVFRGPKYINVDMSVSKRFGLPNLGVLGERPNLDLRFNIFNIFNIRNFSPFQSQSNSTRIVNVAFGEPTGLLAGRVVEFQARFSF